MPGSNRVGLDPGLEGRGSKGVIREPGLMLPGRVMAP